LQETQHPSSWEKIKLLEQTSETDFEEISPTKEKPRFITHLESLESIEGEPIHLEATFQPSRDPDIQVLWTKNGQPLGASQLVRTVVELGWAALDIQSANLDHIGIYILTITNTEGEASSSATIKVVGVGSIISSTQHEDSWRRIQEIEAAKAPELEEQETLYPSPTIEKELNDVEIHAEKN